jgi:ribonuclease HI
MTPTPSAAPRITVHFDGACDPNPGGHAGWGAVISINGATEGICGYVGFGPAMSNNVAEYAGLIGALEELLRRGLENEPIQIFGDSNLVIQQMSGRWKVGKGLYFDNCQKALLLKKKFADLRFTWIPRERNSDADVLSNTGLDSRGAAAAPPLSTAERLAAVEREIEKKQIELDRLLRERSLLLAGKRP